MLENMKMPQVLFKQSGTIFTNLKYLKFGSIVEQEQLGFDNIDSVSFSSNISKLNIEVDTFKFNHCHFLLDVKFDRSCQLILQERCGKVTVSCRETREISGTWKQYSRPLFSDDFRGILPETTGIYRNRP